MQGVLVTGCSTGIGNATALFLAQKGYMVFAGVRSDADASALTSAHANITAVRLDVTVGNDIAATAARIRESGVALAGIVNNAAIVVAGPLEYLPQDRLRTIFEVNVFGTLAVTQAMLPLLREAQGRVVFVSSVSGQIAPPYIGPYAMSKFALEAMADAMRMELSAFGVPVCVVQPGNVRTPIWKKGRDARAAMMAAYPPIAIERYGKAIEGLVNVTQREERSGIPAEHVAQCIYRALTDARPKARYPLGVPPGWARKMAALLPERWRDRLILKNFQA